MTHGYILRLIAVPAILVAALSGCAANRHEPKVASAGGSPTAGAGTTPQAQDAAAQGRRFAKCMRDQGVDVPDPGPDGRIGLPGMTEANQAKIEAASEKCREFLPNGGEPAKPSAEDIAKRREYAKCVRDNGLPGFPDPDPQTGDFSVTKDRADILDKMGEVSPKCQQFGGGAVPSIRIDG
jgi:hypothetical protein